MRFRPVPPHPTRRTGPGVHVVCDIASKWRGKAGEAREATLRKRKLWDADAGGPCRECALVERLCESRKRLWAFRRFARRGGGKGTSDFLAAARAASADGRRVDRAVVGIVRRAILGLDPKPLRVMANAIGAYDRIVASMAASRAQAVQEIAVCLAVILRRPPAKTEVIRHASKTRKLAVKMTPRLWAQAFRDAGLTWLPNKSAVDRVGQLSKLG